MRSTGVFPLPPTLSNRSLNTVGSYPNTHSNTLGVRSFLATCAHQVGRSASRITGVEQTLAAHEELARARDVRDAESFERASQKRLVGVVLVVGWGLYITNTILKVAKVASFHFGALVNFFWGLGATLNIGLSTVGISRCSSFLYSMNRAIKQGNEATLQFLEAYVLGDEAEQKAFRRRVNSEVLEELRSGVLSKCREKQQRGEDISQELQAVVSKIKSASQRKILLFSISLIASFCTLAGAIIGTFFTMGLLPLILYSTATSITLLTAMATAYLAKRNARLADKALHLS